MKITAPVIIKTAANNNEDVTSLVKKSLKKFNGSKVINVESSGKAKLPCGKNIK